jgi:hypothetical protein
MASEDIIRAAQNYDTASLLRSIKWALENIDKADNDVQKALELGIIKAACDMWLVIMCEGEACRTT